VGEAPNLAARLQANAPPDGVVIAETTRRQAGLYFQYRDLGRFVLKGFSASVQAWLVVGETAVASRFEAHRLKSSTTTLIGRSAALTEVLDEWRQARSGSGRLVVLSGDAGIGKSRLARAVCEYAKENRAVRLELDCTPRARHVPLHPVAAILRRLVGFRVAAPDVRQRRLKLLLTRLIGTEAAEAAACYLAPLIGIELKGDALDESPERAREQTIATLVRLIKAVATRRATVLLAEDIHWADPTTRLLLQRIRDELPALALLMIVTTRSSPDKVKLSGGTIVALQLLDEHASQRIVRNIAGSNALDDDLVGRIVRQAEGNPLFLEELTRDFVERATLDPAGGRSAASVAADVPVSLKLTISARLDRHSRLKPYVQAASVLGREFPVRLLQELLPQSSTEVPAAVGQLMNLGLLTVAEGAERDYVRFKHSLIHQAVYRTIFRSDRQRLHSRAAEILQHQFGDTPEASADTLAHHLAAAGRFDDSIRCRINAAESTGRRAAYKESAAHCRAGLEIVGTVVSPIIQNQLKLELLTQLGVALSATLGYATPEVEDVYQQARALCDQYAPPQVLFPIMRGLGTFYFVRGRFDAAAQVSDSCIRLAEESDRPDFRIEALSFRGYTCTYRGELREGRAALETCLDLYRTHRGHEFRYPSPQDAGTAAWSLLPITAWLLGDRAAAEAAASGALDHGKRLAGAFDMAYVHVWLAMLRNMQRRFADAEHHAAACIEICQRHGFSTWLAAATLHACISRACRSALPESTHLLRQMLSAFVGAGAEANATFFLWGLAQGLRVEGNTAAAADVIIEALGRADASRELFFKSELLTLAAELDADEDHACVSLREALELALQQDAAPLALRAALEVSRRKSGFSVFDIGAPPITSLCQLPDEGPGLAALLSGACAVLGLSRTHDTGLATG
jgi:tetratricopeptide (TPR) repeat protein